jgi:hypothetical protein
MIWEESQHGTMDAQSRLHYFNPRDSKFTYNTVSKNKAGFMKQQIKDAEVTRSLYSKLNYLSWKESNG